ncbi:MULTISPECIES: hypothetical protein [Winogradskyella]|uniref:hypothetical protein n=1 Tax=Winogradskyella TaxID=286104 RepID=UPI0015CCB1B5|nr:MULTISPECIES: hypothetical protein [Winogradskyella]QXP78972.1 hypothetical protein H0I32_17520 [Winogradskyella sp. HaHa_3_26]
MKRPNHIKQATSALSIIGLVLLLVFSPCKVRNSFQNIFELPTTEVSNKSISSLKNRVCDVSIDAEIVISKSYNNLQISQAVLSKKSIFNTSVIASSKKQISQNYSARGEIPPLAPYYILYQNNKAYL